MIRFRKSKYVPILGVSIGRKPVKMGKRGMERLCLFHWVVLAILRWNIRIIDQRMPVGSRKELRFTGS
jgi:hypothetical protein